MKCFTNFVILLVFCITLFSTTHNIFVDGSGDFTTIQNAIDCSAQGDTIIVHPGRYYENLDFNGQNVYLTSLYRYSVTEENPSGDRDFIHNTIIDANFVGSAIVFINNENRTAVVNGFTIENGTGYNKMFINGFIVDNDLFGSVGGGVIIMNATPCLLNNIIQNNYVLRYGGGVFIININDSRVTGPLLAGNIIKNNKAEEVGGGVALLGDGNVEFSSSKGYGNSIFNNYAGWVQDLLYYNTVSNEIFTVCLDTISVATSTYDFESYICLSNNIELTFQSLFLEPLNNDIYVNGVIGDDITNDGLSPATPFKTIAYAMHRIATDPINPKTVHIAPGVYKKSTGQFFPIQLKSYITLSGAGPALTIFDGEGHGSGVFITTSAIMRMIPAESVSKEIKISGIQFQNSHNLDMYFEYPQSPIMFDKHIEDKFEVSNCHFINTSKGISFWPSSVLSSDRTSATFKNLYFNECKSTVLEAPVNNSVIENLIISHNGIFFKHLFDGSLATVGGSPINIYSNGGAHILSNVLIYSSEAWGSFTSAFQFSRGTFILNNATIVGNYHTLYHPMNGTIRTMSNASVYVYNSVFYNNSLDIFSSSDSSNSYFYVNNTLLPGGQNSIINLNPHNIYWGFGNIESFEINPRFIDEENHIYQLSESSPLRFAGTTDIAGYTFPEYDLAGNPRVRNGRVSIGAFEYTGSATIADYMVNCNEGNAPLEVQFTDLSFDNIHAWAWDFDGDSVIDSTDQNPVHIYTSHGTYTVSLTVNNGEDTATKVDLITVGPVSENDTVGVAFKNELKENYPNPFNPSTTIAFEIAHNGHVEIDVFNIKGQKVKTLVNEHRSAGKHQVIWDGTDDRGRFSGSGIYFYRLKTDGFVSTRKMLLIK